MHACRIIFALVVPDKFSLGYGVNRQGVVDSHGDDVGLGEAEGVRHDLGPML